ncbi:hypothetical protein AUEXF2481DRAFT_41269 [Aureobasidium subglaciale EXF-2481]|uniref:Uncharacterized protein n=1 Tax=Aureobasidium subglaciale (strain EXF-2481) TaxID=1043005 RepID=A0A074Y8H3_AURSE|nr:uncharacterized protein AUEXF2481DRAFT_41269 [Aureobasidium subglaciale EXF-2481]KEQ94073.1 hypothetical protein AUEXF2481DRAFT_41269 [Aureobasidium subglaciale EXF-2481]
MTYRAAEYGDLPSQAVLALNFDRRSFHHCKACCWYAYVRDDCFFSSLHMHLRLHMPSYKVAGRTTLSGSFGRQLSPLSTSFLSNQLPASRLSKPTLNKASTKSMIHKRKRRRNQNSRKATRPTTNICCCTCLSLHISYLYTTLFPLISPQNANLDMLTLDRHHLNKPRSYLLIHPIFELSLHYPVSPVIHRLMNSTFGALRFHVFTDGLICFFVSLSIQPLLPHTTLPSSCPDLAVRDIIVDHGNQVSGRLARLMDAG